jgi:hypothetical protein
MAASLSRWLETHGAHHDVVTWAAPFGDDWARAWTECPRGDWLLGLAARRGVDPRAVVRAACACARLALEYVPDDEARPRAAIEAAERWVEGHDDDPAERLRAQRAVEAAVELAPDPAVAAAATAALAALASVEAPEQAATAAASTAQAAVLDAGDCAMMSALAYAQSACADRVREHVPLDAVTP